MANTNLTVRKGQCINFGNCSKANTKEVLKVNLGDDFICPECTEGLMEIQPKRGFPPALKWILIIVGILAILGVSGWFGYNFVLENFIGNGTEQSDTHFIHEDFPIPVEGITLNEDSLSFEKTGAPPKQLTATIQPENVSEENKKVIWLSSDETIVTVDSTGLVTAVSNGNVVISAYTLNGLEAICSVSVKGGTPPPIPREIAVPGGTYKGEAKNNQPHGMGTIYYNTHTLIDSRDMKKRYAEAGQCLVGQFRNGRLLQGKLFDKSDKHIETIIIGGGAY